MAVLSLTDAFCYSAGYDFTTDTNNATLAMDVAQLDKTTFGSGGWQELAGGLKTVNLAWSGFWQAAADGQAVDNQAFSALGTSEAYTVGPVETEGQPAYMFQAGKSQYTLLGGVGELAPFSLTANGSDGAGVVRGQLAKARGTVSATGVLGSGVTFTAGPATVYAVFHVFSAGTTITVDVQRDTAGFASPVTVGTIGPITTSGGTWMTPVSHGTADDRYRFNVTAITGTFTVAGAIAAI